MSGSSVSQWTTHSLLSSRITSFSRCWLLRYLKIQRISRITMGGRAFSYRAPIYGTISPGIFGLQTHSLSLKCRLNMYLFSKSYSYPPPPKLLDHWPTLSWGCGALQPCSSPGSWLMTTLPHHPGVTSSSPIPFLSELHIFHTFMWTF